MRKKGTPGTVAPARRKQVEQARREDEARLSEVAKYAPCILWSAKIEAQPVWDLDPFAPGSVIWDFLAFHPDEEAAQRVLPLDVPAGASYANCFYGSHPAEDQAAMNARFVHALHRGDDHYAQDFRCVDRNHRVHWMHEEVSLQAVAERYWKGFGICTDITERKRADEELHRHREHLEELVAERTVELDRANAELLRQIAAQKKAEKQLRLQSAALQAAANGIVITDREGEIEWVNPAFTALTGYSSEEAVGRTFHMLHSGEHDEAVYRELWNTILAGQVWRGELINQRKDGSLYTEEQSITPVRDANGTITHFISIKQDVTVRKQAEAGLRASETRYRRLFETVSDAIHLFDAETLEYVDVNETACKLYGYTHEQFLRLKATDVTANVAASLPTIQAVAVKQLEHVPLRYHKKKDGTVFPVEISMNVFELNGRKIVCAVLRDITQRQKVEEEIAWLASFPAQSPSSVVEVELSGAISYMNPAARRLFPNLPAKRFEHPWLAGLEPMLAKFQNERSGSTGREVRIEDTWFDQIAYYVPERQRLRVYGTDITERKRAEESLRASEARYRGLFETVPDAIAILDAETLRLVDVNTAAKRLFGYDLDEVAHMSAVDFSAEPAETQAVIGHILAGHSVRTPRRFVTKKDGTRFPAEITASAMEINGQKVICAILRDISERLRMETEANALRDELHHVSRVMTMGELTVAMAHELNQPLTAIRTNAEAGQRLLAKGQLDTQESGKILADIVADDQRADNVIRRVRTLLKKGPAEMAWVGLNDIVHEVAALLHGEAAAQGVEIELDLASELPALRADRIALEQVLVNLILNSLQALEQTPAAERHLSVRTSRPDAHSLQLQVADTGTGIPADKLGRLFEPFFSLKLEGLGMGLRICRSIIEAHGGRIWVSNNPGRGATVQFVLPIGEGTLG